MARRVSISLSDEEYRILSEYATVTQDLPTSVAGELVRSMLPRYEILVKAFLLVQSGKVEEGSRLAQSLVLRSINEASGASLELQEEMKGL